MKLFGFGGGGKGLKSKLFGTKFDYTFTVHNLQPWPASNKAIAVGWQQGKKKRGATHSVFPSPQPGKLGRVIRFNEKFSVGATLYKVGRRRCLVSGKVCLGGSRAGVPGRCARRRTGAASDAPGALARDLVHARRRTRQAPRTLPAWARSRRSASSSRCWRPMGGPKSRRRWAGW
jgi:hypothetical protein